MANLRDLRQRISSIGNIQKITRAMEMVATTKLRRYQDRAVSAKPYTGEIEGLVRRLSGAVAGNPSAAGEAQRLFASVNPKAPQGVLFVGSDRGLCGAYNTNVQRLLDQELAELEGEYHLYVIGRKAMQHAKRKGYPVAMYLEDLVLEKMNFSDAANISRLLVQEFLDGNASSIHLCFTRFASMVRFVPGFEGFLPIAPPADAEVEEDTILEPDGASLLGRLIPRFLETVVYHSLLESVTSEYASRRMAMKNATDAAGEMKAEITRDYNKARQQKITSEILEIVSGAEAL
ncbi:MAG: ATP synthase F1 subunit gamma [Planctomycetota bacterium]|nr:MAG: ATP synthase F1 subunit gamma [Planctomycetota bacterium]